MSRGAFARRLLLGAGGSALLALVLGCMNLSIGGRSATTLPAGDGAECGEVTVPARGEIDVYYPVPFASPPNLVVESAWDDCTPVDQHADRFRVRNPGGHPRAVTWKARGVRTAPPPAPDGGPARSADPPVP